MRDLWQNGCRVMSAGLNKSLNSGNFDLDNFTGKLKSCPAPLLFLQFHPDHCSFHTFYSHINGLYRLHVLLGKNGKFVVECWCDSELATCCGCLLSLHFWGNMTPKTYFSNFSMTENPCFLIFHPTISLGLASQYTSMITM